MDLLHKVVGTRGKLIFAMVCGSSCYNLSTAGSDRDLFGVYLANYEGPFVGVKEDFTGHDPDYCIYEVTKYCKLLCKGNPKLIEPLYSERFVWSTPEWEGIKLIRSISLNQTTVTQYKQYSRQQIHNFENDRKQNITNSKKLYHGLRLAIEAHTITLQKPPRIWFEGEDREYLLKIRNNQVDPAEVLEKIEKYQQLSSELIHNLPESVDTLTLSKWALPLKKLAFSQNQSLPLKIDLEDPVSPSPILSKYKDEAEALLKQNNIHGKILFCAPYGKTAILKKYDTEVVDVLCVFAAQTDLILDTLHDVPQVLVPANGPSASTDKYRRGLQLVEVEHFFSLVLQGNHVMTESLYIPPTNLWISHAFESMIPNSSKCSLPNFFTIGHVMHYVGNTESLIKKQYQSDEEKRKFTQMAQRFLEQAKKVYEGKVPDLILELNSVKQADQITTEVNVIKKNIKQSKLPSKNEEARKYLNDWIVSLRKALQD
uniref:Nucleotidyltransferase n=1 Tax=Arcella intermedia TaxID=1963864 RepID=A0A6B2L2M2_9EUKA